MLVIFPNELAVLKVVAGLLNCGWLNALKNSVRNCRVAFSRKPPTVVVLLRAMSQLCWPGPSKTPKPELPKAVPQFVPEHPEAKVAEGGAANADALTKLSIRSVMLPVVSRASCEVAAAENWALEVIGVPKI